MTTDQIHQLLAHGSYNQESIQGRLIETHISWVILTKRYAFKIKKPMKYDFLDFSTLSMRKHYCQRELELNSRFSDIYLDVLPIKTDGSRIFVGQGRGKVIDYAVRMKKLQGTKRMDILLKKGLVSERQILKLAQEIASFHKRAWVMKAPFDLNMMIDRFADIKSLLPWLEENLKPDYARLLKQSLTFSDSFLVANEALLIRRGHQGYKRDVHGDLHTRNIFLYKDPIMFDCIEFNDAFRQLDVLNEVAFLCMDFDAFGRWDLEKLFLRHYIECFPCMSTEEEVRLFVYFKSYRANVRAKVNILRAMQADDDSARLKHISEVERYLKLLESYLKELKAS